jgi:hypothetical protein
VLLPGFRRIRGGQCCCILCIYFVSFANRASERCMVAFVFVCITFVLRVSMGLPSTVIGPITIRTSQFIPIRRQGRADDA